MSAKNDLHSIYGHNHESKSQSNPKHKLKSIKNKSNNTLIILNKINSEKLNLVIIE